MNGSLKPMSVPELIVGPAASGKTRAAVKRAFDTAQTGERVIVLTLPNQREFWLDQLSRLGPSLGVEVTNLQNLCYRMLDRLGLNRPVILNPGRVALTARALERVLERPVAPGEARLYARAIGEMKRHHAVPGGDGDTYRHVLERVFGVYQTSLDAAGVQDLDDVRLRATQCLQATPMNLRAHLIVDGYHSLNPSELEAIRVLASLASSSLVTLPGGAPDTFSDAWAHPLRAAELVTIAERLGAQVTRLESSGRPRAGLPSVVKLEVHPSPVEEARAVLRDIKLHLLEGVPATEMAVVIPHPVPSRVLEALGREYGVPIAPESQGHALETPEGRILEALLGAPGRDYPARDLRVLAVLEPALVRLADALETAGVVSGSRAYHLVCRDQEALAALKRVRALAEPPTLGSTEALVRWFEHLLQQSLSGVDFVDTARIVGREAARLLDPDGKTEFSGVVFTDWLRSLLSSLKVTHPAAGRGVAVIGPEEASGRRFQHVYVIGAVDGAYRAGDAEDFFVPEEQRQELQRLLSGIPGLPLRLTGLEDTPFYDVLTRADVSVTITRPAAERGSSLRPHPRLEQLGRAPNPASTMPTASLFEWSVATVTPQAAARVPWRVRARAASRAATLERSGLCALRAWAEETVPGVDRGQGLVSGQLLRSWSARLRRARWNGDDINALAVVPDAERDRIDSLAPGFRARLASHLDARVPVPHAAEVQLGYRASLDGIEFTLDGVRFRHNRDGEVVALEVYRVLNDASKGYESFMDSTRQREWWFAAWWLDRGAAVSFWAWDLIHAPRRVFGLDKPYAQNRLREAITAFKVAQSSLETGDLMASPGFHCRDCAYRDLCREAV
jgi:hypothetical protein